MQTHFIEVTNGPRNWGKFLLFRFDKEYEYQSAVARGSLLRNVGWSPDNIVVLDLQTGEAARFIPNGKPFCATADLEKHKIWVCPMYQPFLTWLYSQDVTDLTKLPSHVDIPDAEFALAGYRREGPKKSRKKRAVPPTPS